jgi:pyridoxine 5-phosphate synthase
VEKGVRVSLFIDFDSGEMEAVRAIGAERVELYTEPYAAAHGSARAEAVLDGFRNAAIRAQRAGLGVNAGHDLNLGNLGNFLKMAGILEVSIGHALIVECLEEGLPAVIAKYLRILGR